MENVDVEAGRGPVDVTPALLAWQDITFSVQEKKKGKGVVEKTILDRVSGFAAPGTLTAVLGASGSGKSSLLSALAERLPRAKTAKLTGELSVNGFSVDDADTYRSNCAYVLQQEALYPYSTVRETLEFSARLRLGADLSLKEKRRRADEVAQVLGLSKTLDTRVGDGVRVQGISGGERKRVGIACEMVATPSIVLLDEPTSGLDSHQALKTVQSLKELAKTGRTVLCTIHQPGSAIYALFDSVLVLAEGKCAYFGPATKVLKHFEEIQLPCPPLFNPADFLLQVTSADADDEEAKPQLVRIVNHAATLEMKPVAPALGNQPNFSGLQRLTGGASGLEQWTCLFLRCLQDVGRNKGATIGKVMQNLSTSLITIALFKNMGTGEVVAVQERDLYGVLFFMIINGLFGPLFGTVQAFSPEVNIVMRERTAKLYSAVPYYFAKVAVSFPFDVFPLIFGGSVTYWALSFDHSLQKYVVFLFFFCAMASCSQGIGFMLSILAEGNANLASAAVGPMALILMLLGGFYVNTESIPIYLVWISKISYLNFSFQGLCINEFRGSLLLAGDAQSNGDGCPPDVPHLCKTGEAVLDDMFNNGQSRTQDDWERVMMENFLKLLIWLAIVYTLGCIALTTKGPKFLKRSKA
jgi:ABC-type multidrug transport system ATPase subunit